MGAWEGGAAGAGALLAAARPRGVQGCMHAATCPRACGPRWPRPQPHQSQRHGQHAVALVVDVLPDEVDAACAAAGTLPWPLRKARRCAVAWRAHTPGHRPLRPPGARAYTSGSPLNWFLNAAVSRCSRWVASGAPEEDPGKKESQLIWGAWWRLAAHSWVPTLTIQPVHRLHLRELRDRIGSHSGRQFHSGCGQEVLNELIRLIFHLKLDLETRMRPSQLLSGHPPPVAARLGCVRGAAQASLAICCAQGYPHW